MINEELTIYILSTYKWQGETGLGIYEKTLKIKNDIPKEVTLIAVSKTRSIEEMEEAYKAGIRDFGENKVQEFKDKFENFYDDIKWHFIGHLQTNKVKYLVGKIDLLHSLDRISLLHEIEKQYKSKNKICNALIEINIGREESKTGLLVENLEELLVAVEKCQNIKIKGLMAVIPKGNENQCKNYFKEMKKIFDALKERDFKNISMEFLSMGMTNDYKLAIEESSNMVRVGQGIFGERIYKK